MKLTKNEFLTLKMAVRQFLYFVLLIVFSGLLYELADIYKENTFNEHGAVENLQLIFLISSGVIFGVFACFYKAFRPLLVLFASFAFLASFRELDKFFDAYEPFLSWKIGFLFPLSALFYILKNKRVFLKNFFAFLNSPLFPMMVMVLVVVVPLAQCIGHNSFIEAVLGDYKHKDIKEFIEEAGETFGYFLLFLSTIECYFALLKKR